MMILIMKILIMMILNMMILVRVPWTTPRCRGWTWAPTSTANLSFRHLLTRWGGHNDNGNENDDGNDDDDDNDYNDHDDQI